MNGNNIVKMIAIVLFVILLSTTILAQTGIFNKQIQQENNGVINNDNNNDNGVYQQQQQQVQGGSCGGGGCGCGGSQVGITNQNNPSDATNTIATVENNGVQEIEVSYKDYGYYPNIITLKKDVPVKMTFDLNRVQGCMRAVQIKAFGVSKYLKEGDNVLTFTPNKTGTFTMQCSMGMGKATIVVE